MVSVFVEYKIVQAQSQRTSFYALGFLGRNHHQVIFGICVDAFCRKKKYCVLLLLLLKSLEKDFNLISTLFMIIDDNVSYDDHETMMMLKFCDRLTEIAFDLVGAYHYDLLNVIFGCHFCLLIVIWIYVLFYLLI